MIRDLYFWTINVIITHRLVTTMTMGKLNLVVETVQHVLTLRLNALHVRLSIWMVLIVFHHVLQRRYLLIKYAFHVNQLVWHVPTSQLIVHHVCPTLPLRYFWTIIIVLKHVLITHTRTKQQVNVNHANLRVWNVRV